MENGYFEKFLQNIHSRHLLAQSQVWHGKTRTMCEILKKLIIKIPEQRRSAVVTANFEQISLIVLVFTILAPGQ